MDIYLLIDFGSTYTKLTAIDANNECLLDQVSVYTTIETNILDSYNSGLMILNNKYSNLNIIKTLACSSAAGGLKIAVIGNVEKLTVEAAKKAALGAGAKITKTYSFEINNDELNEIVNGDVDLLLLSGGTDGGNKEYILSNANKISQSNISIPVVYAGNKSCIDEVKKMFTNTNIDIYYTENIMPRLEEINELPVREKIREVFMKHIIYAKGIDKITEIVNNDIIPTPLSVLNAANLLSVGTKKSEGIGELIIFDIGGATTDVHSICDGFPSRGDVTQKGLEEPFTKRTVEGDLGMRYSSLSLLESVGERTFKSIDSCINDELINNNIIKRKENVKLIPSTNEEIQFDELMAKICIQESIDRHSGELFTTPTPFGDAYYQIGKDLTKIKYVIGTGGVLVHSDNYSNILQYCEYKNEKPTKLNPVKPTYLKDKHYILSALGLLQIENKELALKLLKKYIVDKEII